MHLLRSRLFWWVALNLAGMVVYLMLASELWVLPGEEGTPGGPGDAFYWLFFLVPILATFVVVDLVALFFIVRHARQLARWKAPIVSWFAVIALWVAVVAFDHHRAFRVIDPPKAAASQGAVGV